MTRTLVSSIPLRDGPVPWDLQWAPPHTRWTTPQNQRHITMFSRWTGPRFSQSDAFLKYVFTVYCVKKGCFPGLFLQQSLERDMDHVEFFAFHLERSLTTMFQDPCQSLFHGIFIEKFHDGVNRAWKLLDIKPHDESNISCWYSRMRWKNGRLAKIRLFIKISTDAGFSLDHSTACLTMHRFSSSSSSIVPS